MTCQNLNEVMKRCFVVEGRGRFAEVWKGSLQHEDNACQVVSVKVFQLRNYGAWRQEKDMLTEG